VGGLWGGTFTKANYLWARWFRHLRLIKTYPILEVLLVIIAVASLQFINPATRARYDVIIRHLLIDCASQASTDSWVCRAENDGSPLSYVLWLAYGTLIVLATTTITAGIKVPSGIIMPALAGGALFGRLAGQVVATESISPGIFAMVSAGAFLAGVTRMTISLCVVMFELTGELEYVVPHMVAILCAKWTADAVSRDSIYDLTQSALGHPFLSPDEALREVAEADAELAERLIPPAQTMAELTVVVPRDNVVPLKLLRAKLEGLKRRGLMDSGLVLVQANHMVQGYLPQHELEFGLKELAEGYHEDATVRLLGNAISEGELDLSRFINRAPICICASAPIEVVVAIFTQLGVRYVCLTEEGTG
jgi:chloride channel 3/4/5